MYLFLILQDPHLDIHCNEAKLDMCPVRLVGYSFVANRNLLVVESGRRVAFKLFQVIISARISRL